jgi:alpha-beta hydrolase superfamily lysophospholipase
MELLTIATKDTIELSAILWDLGMPRSALLLHMMPAVKESWVDFAGLLTEQGFNVLAIDFRGHGESAGGDYQLFTSQDHQKYYTDTESAVEFLSQRYPESEIVIGGASIGANVAIKYMAGHSEIQKVFALSAGLDYHGVIAQEDVQKLRSGQNLLLVGARDDLRGSGADCGTQAEQLYDLATCKKEKIIFDQGGHGTDLLAAHLDLPDSIIHFLTSR